KPACDITHRQLLSGLCPYCDLPVLNGEIVIETVNTPATPMRWNVARLIADVRDQDRDISLEAVTNIWLHGTILAESILVLQEALATEASDVRELASQALISMGAKLS